MLASGMPKWMLRSRSWAGVTLLLVAGCGSVPVTDLPSPAGPPVSPLLTATPAGTTVLREVQPSPPATIDGGRTLVRVLARERVLELSDARTGRRSARVPAGVGPTHVACLRLAWCYVTDTQGDALLVFRRAARLELVRRYYLPGGPYALALDRRRRLFYVTLPGRNDLVQLPAHGRPHVLRRWPTVRQPDALAVDEVSGGVTVTGDAASQIVRP
jgi:hypothetical protein